MRNGIVWSVVAAMVLATIVTGTARADFATLGQRLPAETSAIVAINAKRVMQSPYAVEQQWAETMAESWARRPQMVQPGVSRVLMGADVTPSTMESIWEACLMEMDEMPTVEEMAKAEGGHIDRVWDRNAVVSPINAYFIPLDNGILAAVTPGERRIIAKWLREPVKPSGSVTSDYIQQALAGLGEQTDVVMAIDLEGAFGVPNIRRFLEDSENAALENKNLDQLAGTIGTLRGIMLSIRIDSKLTGKAVIEFTKDAKPLEPVAQPLLSEVLIRAGMNLEDLDQWKFAANGKQVTAEGDVSEAMLRQLLSVVQTPVPAIVNSSTPSADATAAAAAATGPAAASQRYYKAVSSSIDALHKGASMAASATWLRQTAKRIDQLPILNVDPALVEWGAMVSSKLKQASAALAVNQTQTNARVAGVMNPEYGGYYNDQGDYSWDSGTERRAAYENARLERRKVATEQKAQGQQQAMQILDGLTGSRQAVRAQMVAKYGVEF